MSDATTLGDRLKLLRHERSMTRGELADRSGVNTDVIEKLEHGHRETARVTWLMKLAGALRTELSGLLGGPRHSGTAVRDAVTAPESTPGMDPDDAGETPDLGELRRAVDGTWRAYWSGDLPHVAMRLPGLLGETRLAHRGLGARAATPLADAHHLAARLLSSLGETDLAALAAREAIEAAESGDDELRWTALHGSYCSALLHQNRCRICEDHAVHIAEDTEPPLGAAELRRLTVWGNLILTAMAAAGTTTRTGAVNDYVGLARSAADRFDGERLDYHVRFGPSEVAMHATHAYALLREPGLALQAAGAVHREDLPRAMYGRHLLDVAQAQAQLMDLRAAESTLQEAESLSRRSFRDHGPAYPLVGELIEEMAHVSPDLRRMAQEVALEG
ncbi:helix-turn-helix domain-containing protein [Actinoallomurus sp. NBC_01490]|uniref:helix-turn-helix domain-containing protein n=1 Tax=Actinoallomurus sp. NBC_01490 TaxID=2903557 RepID=UPI002E361C45|nr:helix-turn-helix domain-containing protein [Actinoallomurus sp. NBC_01490]